MAKKKAPPAPANVIHIWRNAAHENIFVSKIHPRVTISHNGTRVIPEYSPASRRDGDYRSFCAEFSRWTGLNVPPNTLLRVAIQEISREANNEVEMLERALANARQRASTKTR